MTRSSLSVVSPPYFAASSLSRFRLNSITAAAVTSCGLSNMICYRLREYLGSETIVASGAGRADYSDPDVEAQERIYITGALLDYAVRAQVGYGVNLAALTSPVNDSSTPGFV